MHQLRLAGLILLAVAACAVLVGVETADGTTLRLISVVVVELAVPAGLLLWAVGALVGRRRRRDWATDDGMSAAETRARFAALNPQPTDSRWQGNP